MEGDIPSAGEPPLAKIREIQFGLMTSEDICKLSVFASAMPVTNHKQLSDPQLGLPTARGKCGTCNAKAIDECPGHFAHCELPLPIFHPNHVGKLVTLLRKVCLNCGNPKKKKAGKYCSLLEDQTRPQQCVQDVLQLSDVQPTPMATDTDEDNSGEGDESIFSSKNKRKYPEYIDMEAGVVDNGRPDTVILLSSSDEEDMVSSAANHSRGRSEDDETEKASCSAAPPNAGRKWDLRKRKRQAESTGNSVTRPSAKDMSKAEARRPPSAANGGKRQKFNRDKAPPPIKEEVDELFCPLDTTAQTIVGPCKYCSGHERYPEVALKILVNPKGKDENLSKSIQMEYKVKQKDAVGVARDYWNFVDGAGHKQTTPAQSRLLLPSEALKILEKIPKSAHARLGMHPGVAPPEALIVKCVPVPPNCTRIQDDLHGITSVGYKQGIDRATQIFTQLVNRIKKNAGLAKPDFHAASLEASELQYLLGLYLREKGAPKAVPGKEKKRIDHVGREQNAGNRWSLEWLKRHLLGKRGGHSARNVVTGDPFLNVEEIGIPRLFAKNVTIPERVNDVNKKMLEDCIEVGQTLTGRYRACGAVRLWKNGTNERLEVTRRTTHTLEIGDIVHRHLRDGDLVYVNRPPSLHKHSLLALKVCVQDIPVFTINPAVCAPLHADFDGDCLHVFVPQSEEAKAELHQLMSIPEQILPSLDAKAIIGMSQDNILATHLLTSNAVFLSKEEMCQIAIWAGKELSIPAIVKSKDGPFWTGKQVIDMTLPDDFTFSTKSNAAWIENGELMSYGGKEKWLSSANGLICALARQNPQAAVKHLNCCQSALREWLLSRGFSASLQDFYVAACQKSRKKMVDELKTSLIHAAAMTTRMELIISRDYQKVDGIQSVMERGSDHTASQIGDMAVGYFQQQFSEIGEDLASHIGDENQLMAMFRSGSKGSLPKVIQQIGCLGLQLYKGEKLMSLSGNAKLESLVQAMSCEELWEAQGLVKSSLLDGLEPLEFYLHSIAVRAGLLRQSLEVTSPGELFKNLMLFLRDIHISYDDTVRSSSGQEIIQFSYGGGAGTPSTEDTSGNHGVFEPGEAVGILAATAIAQPAYQIMLEANHLVGSKKIRPLALLQDTIFPRKESKLKAADRRIILRLTPCRLRHSDERRILSLRNELQPVSLGMIATSLSIQYISVDSWEWDECRENGIKLTLPWIGHIQLNKNAMVQGNMDMDRTVGVIEAAFRRKKYRRTMEGGYLANPVFFYRDTCDCRRAAGTREAMGPCLQFSASLKSHTSKRMASRSDEKLLEFVDALRDVMVPLIFKTIVKGDERVESAKILWEDAAWSPYRVRGEQMPIGHTGELVVEVVVQERLSSRRGTPWIIITEACAHLEDIDWQRSAPYSVQEVRHSLGVEAARDCIFERLAIAAQSAGPASVGKTHLKLVTDLMVHSGDVNGMTASGYRDRLRSLKSSAPFTSGAFRAPIKTFMEAGEKGEKEYINGVLASSIFGKRVPLGTGADFTLQLQPKLVADALEPLQSADVLDQLAELNGRIKAQFPESPGVTVNRDVNGNADENCAWETADRETGPEDEEGTWNMRGDTGGWDSEYASANPGDGAYPSKHDENGWVQIDTANANEGEADAPVFTSAAGLWDSEDARANLGDCASASKHDENDFGQVDTENGTGGGAGEPMFTSDAGLWDSGDVGVMHEVADGWGKNLDIIEECPETNANEGVNWRVPSPAMCADDGNWGVEMPLPTRKNGDTFSESAIENEPASVDILTDWGSSVVDQDEPDNDRHLSTQLGEDSSRKDKKERLRRTGANMIEIPPEKMRKFGKMDSGNAASKSEMSHLSEKGTIRQEPESLSKWTTTSVQEDQNDGLWGQGLDSQSLRETPSDWNSQTGSTAFGSHPEHTKADSSRGNGHCSQTGGNPSDGGRSTPRTENTRRIDSRKDSSDWKDLIEIVRTVREILQEYKVDDKLSDEHADVIKTQVLPHHPNSAAKVGCGVKFIKVATSNVRVHNERASTCFFVVRHDGTEDDFSYHKCLKNLASKKNPPLNDLYETAFGRRPSRYQN